MEEYHWEKDDLLSDFTFDTLHTDVGQDDPGSVEDLEFNNLQAVDASLSSYMSHGLTSTSAGNTGVANSSVTDVQHVGSEVSLSEDSDNAKCAQGQIIVLTRPQQYKSKGDSNSRQAVAARENREKKKQYISGLEAQIEKLSKDNETLRSQDAHLQKMVTQLQEEVSYLRNIIANQSALSAVLRNIHKSANKNMKLSVSAALSSSTPQKQQSCQGQTHVSSIGTSIPGKKRKIPCSLSQNDGSQNSSNHTIGTKKLCLSSAVSTVDKGAGNLSNNMKSDTVQTDVPSAEDSDK